VSTTLNVGELRVGKMKQVLEGVGDASGERHRRTGILPGSDVPDEGVLTALAASLILSEERRWSPPVTVASPDAANDSYSSGTAVGELLALPACPSWAGNMKQRPLGSTSAFGMTRKRQP
jgi:hypothetical protein